MQPSTMLTCWSLCCGLLLLSGCRPVVYMPVEPAYDATGQLRTDGHYVKDSYLLKLSHDLEACGKTP